MTNPITTSAVRLRLFLLIAMGLAIVAIVALVVYGVKYLDDYAAEVNQTVYESSTSNERLTSIRRQVDMLENNTSAVERARQIVAESQSYRYQDVIVRDLQSFADKAGIRIVNFNFVNQETEANANANADQAPPPEGVAPGDGMPRESQQPVSQLKSTTVNITLANPVDYQRLLQFIHYIEQNLTKMQIASISLSGSSESNSSVVTDSLSIEVYIR